MRPQVIPSEDGYTIRGIEPADIGRFPDDVRLMWWRWVVEVGLSQKDKDLAKGIDAHGHPLKAILPATRKHRRSEMTPSGRGAPEAPPLTPGYQKSRARSLLTGKAFADRAEFWWKFDPLTHDSFARILEYQAQEGRDVFGLSPAALRRMRLICLGKYDDWKKGKAEKAKPEVKEFTVTGGQRDLSKIDLQTTGANLAGHVGFRTATEWQAYLRGTSKAALPGRPRTVTSRSPFAGPDYNRLLAILFGMTK